MLLEIKDASLKEWAEAYEADLDATFSQSIQWNQLWAGFLKMELAPKTIMVDGLPCGVLPLIAQKGVIETSYCSGINGYGGILNASAIALENYSNIVAFIIKKFKNIKLYPNPFSGFEMKHQFNNWGGEEVPSYASQVVDLRNGFGELFKNWTKGHSSAAKSSMKLGVVIRKAHSVDEWKAYFEVYQDSLRRWGEKTTSRHSWEIFHSIFQIKDPNVVLWVAEHQGKIVAGALCFYGHRHVAYWHGAVLEASMGLKAPHLLQYRIMEDATENGHHWYDMLSSGGHIGVEKFKNGFNAKPINVYLMQRRSKIFRIISMMTQMTHKLYGFRQISSN